MSRPVPPQAVDLVARWEGCELRAYPDPATGEEPWTIGYGHTREVRRGQTITQAQAREFLRQDLAEAAVRLAAVVKPPVLAELTDNQYSALLSFVFNVGANSSWTIWKRLNAGNFDAVPVEIMRFVNAGGRKLQGLVNRRTDEVRLWSLEEPGSTPENPPSSRTRIEPTPPTPLVDKALAKSKTLWAGGTVAATGVVSGASQVQQLVAPQMSYSQIAAKIAAVAAGIIIVAGIAIIAFKWLEQRSRHV